MPWSKKTTTRQQYLDAAKKVNKKARVLHELKIKRLSGGAVAKFSGLFTAPIIHQFSWERDIKWQTCLMVVIMDFYHVFLRSDAWLWGFAITDAKLTEYLRDALDHGYIEKDGKQHTASYFHTLKGKKLVEEYNNFYSKRVKEILKSNSIENQDVKYKFKKRSPKHPKRFSGSDKPQGGQLEQNSKRRSARNIDR